MTRYVIHSFTVPSVVSASEWPYQQVAQTRLISNTFSLHVNLKSMVFFHIIPKDHPDPLSNGLNWPKFFISRRTLVFLKSCMAVT